MIRGFEELIHQRVEDLAQERSKLLALDPVGELKGGREWEELLLAAADGKLQAQRFLESVLISMPGEEENRQAIVDLLKRLEQVERVRRIAGQ